MSGQWGNLWTDDSILENPERILKLEGKLSAETDVDFLGMQMITSTQNSTLLSVKLPPFILTYSWCQNKASQCPLRSAVLELSLQSKSECKEGRSFHSDPGSSTGTSITHRSTVERDVSNGWHGLLLLSLCFEWRYLEVFLNSIIAAFTYHFTCAQPCAQHFMNIIWLFLSTFENSFTICPWSQGKDH